jgi:hypothetical protein
MRPERAVALQSAIELEIIKGEELLTLVGHVLVGDLAVGIAGELGARPGAVELFVAISFNHPTLRRSRGMQLGEHSHKP